MHVTWKHVLTGTREREREREQLCHTIFVSLFFEVE